MKNHKRNLTQLVGTLCLSLYALVAKAGDGGYATETASDEWSFSVVPYLWLALYDGTFELPNVPPGIGRTKSTTSSDPFSTSLSGAFMMTAQVRYREFGLFLDGAWLQLKTEGDYPTELYSGTDIKSDIAYGTAALTYRIVRTSNLSVDALAGARVWYLSNEIDFDTGTQPGFNADDHKTFVDPIVGASIRYDLTKHFFGVVVGDAGGFGTGSDLTWNVFGGIGYQFTSWLSATVGYRYMHMDYSKDNFVMDANVQGFLIGLGFHF